MSDAPNALGNTPAPETPAAGGDPNPNPNPNPAPAVTIPDNWKDALPDDVKSFKGLENIKTLQDLGKSYVHAQQAIGKKGVIPPDPKFATDDDWTNFYQGLGLPKDVKDYKVELPKGAQVDEKFLGEFTQMAHKFNVMPAQAQKLLHWYLAKEDAMGKETQQQVLGEITQKLDAYKQQTGAAFQKKVLFANKTLEKFGGPELMKMFAQNPAIGNNPQFIEAFAKIGEQLFGEDSFEGDRAMAGAMTPEEARNARNTIMNDQKHPYWHSEHPGHKDAVAYVNKLFEFENPSR